MSDHDKCDKPSVNYRHTISLTQRCKTCKYSYGPTDARRCEKVKGIIHGGDVCDLWEGKK